MKSEIALEPSIHKALRVKCKTMQNCAKSCFPISSRVPLTTQPPFHGDSTTACGRLPLAQRSRLPTECPLLWEDAGRRQGGNRATVPRTCPTLWKVVSVGEGSYPGGMAEISRWSSEARANTTGSHSQNRCAPDGVPEAAGGFLAHPPGRMALVPGIRWYSLVPPSTSSWPSARSTTG